MRIAPIHTQKFGFQLNSVKVIKPRMLNECILGFTYARKENYSFFRYHKDVNEIYVLRLTFLFLSYYILMRGLTIRDMIQNKRVEISKNEARQFWKMGKVAYVATVDEEGYPYVILFVYVYEGKLYLHIGNILESHFWSNIKQNPKISIEVSEMGDLHPGKKYSY